MNNRPERKSSIFNQSNRKPVKETSRTYHFPEGSVTLKDIVEVVASETTHRLKTSDGKLHIIPNGWLHIEVVSPYQDWSF